MGGQSDTTQANCCDLCHWASQASSLLIIKAHPKEPRSRTRLLHTACATMPQATDKGMRSLDQICAVCRWLCRTCLRTLQQCSEAWLRVTEGDIIMALIPSSSSWSIDPRWNPCPCPQQVAELGHMHLTFGLLLRHAQASWLFLCMCGMCVQPN